MVKWEGDEENFVYDGCLLGGEKGIMITTEDLVGKGYLPYELIPAMSTKKLSKAVRKVLQKTKGKDVAKSSRYYSYSIPKVKHVRRTLAIPNPIHQINLSEIVNKNWLEIEKYISQSPISKSKPVIEIFEFDTERAFSREINLSDIPIEQAKLSVDARYLLRADISRFYPTIYTHIIPWALHTKKIAKENVKKRIKLYGDNLDDAVRSTQANQTIGIPIGPDTSFLISEIVGTAIDLDLERRLKGKKIKLVGFRFVDDIFLYFKNISDANYALSALHLTMKDFELELNPEKTKIIELPVILEPKWVLELRQLKYHIGKNEELYNDDLITYFSKAFELSKLYPDESVLKYSLTEIVDSRVDEKNWALYESLLLNAVIAEPSVLPTVTEIFLAYNNEKYKLNKKKIASTLFELISFHSQYNHVHEITWALWLCKTLKIKLTTQVTKIISSIDDSLVALISLDLYNNNLITRLNTDLWRERLNKENLYTEHWLLAYEGMKKGWIAPIDGKDYLEEDEFFKELKENDVEFYIPENQVTPALIKETYRFQKKVRSRQRRKKRFY
ncbi:RNA-directed DNA polymerase [Paenibacillus sp. GYB003]|uniref:RNA-directed DNA polymerase n=1 Tax=Paenibacillus sp. GYB003 TaxID=2994392 RepID=UPI002F96903C